MSTGDSSHLDSVVMSYVGNLHREVLSYVSPHSSNQPEECESSSSSANSVDLIFGVPPLVTDKIFSHFTYDEISKIRMISREFNDYAKLRLNRGFERLGKQIESARSSIKRELPRRESQRRSHRLSRINDIYAALDTRYALLSMTYRKYIKHPHTQLQTCFIPGKVLDEFFRVMDLLNRCRLNGGQFGGDATEILKDVRDLSSMAMEHYEEFIQPELDRISEQEKFTAAKNSNRGKYHRRFPSISFSVSPSTSSGLNVSSPREIGKTMEDKIDALEKQCCSLKKDVKSLQDINTSLVTFMVRVFPEHRDDIEKLALIPPRSALEELSGYTTDSEVQKTCGKKRSRDKDEPVKKKARVEEDK